MGSCHFCFFRQMAERARAKAKEWDDQRLPYLASPHRKAAADFDAMATGEGRCSCGEPLPDSWEKKIKRRVKPEEDSLDPL